MAEGYYQIRRYVGQAPSGSGQVANVPSDAELREDNTFELREDGSFELRDG